MTPEKQAHIMELVDEYLYAPLKQKRAAIEAALRDAPQAEPVAWHVNFRGSSHLLTSLESVDLTDCIVTPLYPEPRAPDNTLKDRLLAALERAAGAESALRRLEDKTEPLTQTRGYHALVQVIYELQQDGNYSDEEGEETSALVELLRAIEATPSAPTAVEPPELSMSMFASVADFEAAKRRAAVEPDERAEFEAWAGPITALAKENGKYVEVMTSLAWECWSAARASKGTP